MEKSSMSSMPVLSLSQNNQSSTTSSSSAPPPEEKKTKTSPRKMLQMLMPKGLGKSSSKLFHTRSEILPTMPPLNNGSHSSRKHPEEPHFAPLINLPASQSVPNSVFMGAIASSTSVSDMQNKKVTFTRPSLKLDDLIPHEKKPELWRKTLTYEIQNNYNNSRIKESKRYLWHTQASLRSMYSLEKINEIQELQRLQIVLLREFFGDVLDPIFQRFLEDYPDDYPQAESFANYLCKAIECVMDAGLFKELPMEEQGAMLGVAEYITCSVEQQNEQYITWYYLSSMKMVSTLEFYKAHPKPSIEKIAGYIKDNLDLGRCNEIISTLRKLCERISNDLRKNQLETANIGRKVDEEGIPEYLSLLNQLPKQGNFSKEVIAKIASQLSGESLLARRQHPTCTKEETDFFIPVGSPLCNIITTIIVDFAQENTFLFKRTDASLSPRHENNLSPRKTGSLIKEECVSPRKESPRKESPRIQSALVHKLSEQIVKALQSRDIALIEIQSTCKP